MVRRYGVTYIVDDCCGLRGKFCCVEMFRDGKEMRVWQTSVAEGPPIVNNFDVPINC
jgi:hypothetical protein